jgi:hypothetical protein
MPAVPNYGTGSPIALNNRTTCNLERLLLETSDEREPPMSTLSFPNSIANRTARECRRGRTIAGVL